MSEDGQFGFSIIALIGSVFSPYYAWSGRHNPSEHIALNVGIYGKGVKRWTMTERGSSALKQSRTNLLIGPSDLSWDGTSLTINIDEWAMPIPFKVKGTLKLTPHGITQKTYQLDENGRHFWRPIAPSCDVECNMEAPDTSWRGHGYIDSNWGSEPLEDGFTHWDWSRAELKNGAGLLYDAFTKRGVNRQFILKFARDGSVEEMPAPPRKSLKKCPIWRIPRTTLTEDSNPQITATLEDTPFYSRSQIQSEFDGEVCRAVHESLDLNAFSNPIVRCLLPFRMPRRANYRFD